MAHPVSTSTALPGPPPAGSLQDRLRQLERAEWWMWFSAILVTLLLTLCVVSFALPVRSAPNDPGGFHLSQAVQGLVGLVLLFDLYTVFQCLQLHRMRRRVAEQEGLFHLIATNSADMIALVDQTGQRIYNSPAYERILGYTPAELKETSTFEQVHPHDRGKVMEAGQEAYRTGIGRRLEYRMKHKNGGYRILESTASVVPTMGREPQRLVIVTRDITERRELEAQLQQAQKMEVLGQLAGGIAHEFRNLLTVIIGCNELAREDLEPNHPARKYIEEAVQTGFRASAITEQLLSFSRRQVVEAKPLDLNLVVADAGKMLRRLIPGPIALVTTLEPGLPPIQADPAKLYQVIANLVVNARDAIPGSGTIKIETASVVVDADSPGFSDLPPGPCVTLAVSDDGIGMDAETRERIFEPFFTTKEPGKGTGLGLSVVYGIVKDSRGSIRVFSEPAKGSTLQIHFPCALSAVSCPPAGCPS